MHEYAERCLHEQKEMRELVEKVVEGHKNAKQAKLKLQKYKQQIGIYILPEKLDMMPNVPRLLCLEGQLQFFWKTQEVVGNIQDINSHKCKNMNFRTKLVAGRSEILTYCLWVLYFV